MANRKTISNAIALLISILYSLAGQAHFTSHLTPGLAANIEAMTPNSHAAFHFLGLEYTTIKRLFGAFDLAAAALLVSRTTRTAGLCSAVVGFSGGLYGQLHAGDDVGQVGTLLLLAVVGLVLRMR
ncbi:hypothetical protein LTR37_013925 [Vermiconidia calcicola]|uniref:Uncharacterized protein n=1 Tax=Vermiconidia calcicola TaxID=1690605 RepID=A0ACC3MVI8_9PEZI|nr:hypothetical protein LTR37_013925 [Vermiconidia calcicola]